MLDAMLAIRVGERQRRNASAVSQIPSFARLVRFVRWTSTCPVWAPLPMPVKGRQSALVEAHQADMMVATWQRTSVNHLVRAASRGEAATAHGTAGHCKKPSRSPMARGLLCRTCIFRPAPASPSVARMERYHPTPTGKPSRTLGSGRCPLHGSQGILGAPSHGLLNQARALRNTRLDPESRFGSCVRRKLASQDLASISAATLSRP